MGKSPNRCHLFNGFKCKGFESSFQGRKQSVNVRPKTVTWEKTAKIHTLVRKNIVLAYKFHGSHAGQLVILQLTKRWQLDEIM